jgi:hypothetical protein
MMDHQTRRGLRVIVNLIHIVVQFILMWLIAGMLGDVPVQNTLEYQTAVRDILVHLSFMFGAFAVYYTLIKLLTRHHSSYEQQ